MPDEVAVWRCQAAVAEGEWRAKQALKESLPSDTLGSPGIPGIAGSKALRITQAVKFLITEASAAMTPEEELQSLATSAVRYDDGPTVYAFGTKSHLIFRRSIEELQKRGSPLAAETSYLGGDTVNEGTRGSIRVDVLIGNPAAPTAIYDLKTEAGGLVAARINQIRNQIPRPLQDIPIRELTAQ